MTENFGLHFELIEERKYLLIQASLDGEMVAGGKFTADQVSDIIAALSEHRNKMSAAESN